LRSSSARSEALDLLASIVLLVRRWDWGWWLVIGMQVGVFVLAQIEAQLIDPNSPGWSVFSRIPLLTLFLLFAVRLAEAMLKRPVERNVTLREML
jgi:cbb3-type cytochrome oxidase subunit 1